MVSIKKAETHNELEQILHLQQENLPAVVSSEEKEKEGFVTVEHGLDILVQMNNSCQHIIAVNSNKVVGYALCMHPKFGNEIPVLMPMFSEIKKQGVTNGFIVMGQICIDKAFRKQGVFRRLYKTMLDSIKPEFTRIITEVDIINTRSIEAHHAIGFQKISNYKSSNHHWELMKLEQFRAS